jgi:hypothetical protein
MTRGVADFDPTRITVLVNRVRRFDAFTPDNDPHGEHDFGAFDDGGVRFFWKIDLYEEPGVKNADGEPAVSRVLTVMLAEEY